jgi:hypothetical protein
LGVIVVSDLTLIAELDIVFPLKDVEAQVIGEQTVRIFPAGTPGTVMLIHFVDAAVAAYEVEFPLGGGAGALATISASELARAPEGYRRACPCCGHRTLDDLSPGSYEICPVCFWEDDLIQFEDPAFRGGANRVSLTEARRNYAQFGACDRQALTYVRPPNPSEMATLK